MEKVMDVYLLKGIFLAKYVSSSRIESTAIYRLLSRQCSLLFLLFHSCSVFLQSVIIPLGNGLHRTRFTMTVTYKSC